MADDLDKFVLQYQVDLKDSIGRLEKLQEKMNGVGKSTSKTKGEVKQFAADVAGELGKLVPGLNAVSGAVRAMGAEFAAATVALGALAVGVKLVMNMREQYNQQRGQGMDMGVSSIRVENWQRQFVRQGNGYVTRDSAAEGIKSFSEMSNAAYTDPSRIGKEARLMKMLGVDVGARGQTPTGLTGRMAQLASGLQGKSTGEVQGIAKATGFNQDWLLTLQRLGPQISSITDLTQKEIDQRVQAEGSLSKFNDQLATLKEKFTELSNELAEPLIPALTKLVELMTKLAAAIPKQVHDAGKSSQSMAEAMSGVDVKTGKLDKGIFGILKSAFTGDMFKPGQSGNKWGLAGAAYDAIMGPSKEEQQKKADEAKKQATQKEDQKKKDQQAAKLDETNKQGLQTANEMALAVNMFAGAVQSFSSAINLQQAWAAWAGEIGRANNLPGASGSTAHAAVSLTGGGRGDWTRSQYSSQIKAASSAYGMDPQLIYSVMMAESTGVNGKYSSTGAGGLMQITKGNWSKLGAGDIMDPAGNIMVGTRLLKDHIRYAGGDLTKGLNDYNGNSDPNYVSKVNGFYGSNVRGIGASQSDLQKVQVQQSIADYLHVPLQQIQMGGVHRGDAQWAAGQLDAGIQNGIYDTKRQLATAGLPQQTYAKLQQDLVTQSRSLDLLRQYQGDVTGAQQAGERTRTIGEMPIYININGVTDPKAVGAAVNDALRKSMTDLLVNNATGIKG